MKKWTLWKKVSAPITLEEAQKFLVPISMFVCISEPNKISHINLNFTETQVYLDYVEKVLGNPSENSKERVDIKEISGYINVGENNKLNKSSNQKGETAMKNPLTLQEQMEFCKRNLTWFSGIEKIISERIPSYYDSYNFTDSCNFLANVASYGYTKASVGNILQVVKMFYSLEAMSVIMTHKPTEAENWGLVPFKHSHEVWSRDFHEYRNVFNKQFARAIYDYIVLAVAGELRHCSKRSKFCIFNYLDGTNSETERSDVFINVSADGFNSDEILDAAIWLFDNENNYWESGYGGWKWQNIAKAGKMYGTCPDAVFIDHCVDLSHNNSSFFDKGAGIFHLNSSSAYLDFLGSKRYCADPVDILMDMHEGVGQGLENLIYRAVNLGIFPSALKNCAIYDMQRTFVKLRHSNLETDIIFDIIKDKPERFERFRKIRAIKEYFPIIPLGYASDYDVQKVSRTICAKLHENNAVEWNIFTYLPVQWGDEHIGEFPEDARALESNPIEVKSKWVYNFIVSNYWSDDYDEEREEDYDEDEEYRLENHDYTDPEQAKQLMYENFDCLHCSDCKECFVGKRHRDFTQSPKGLLLFDMLSSETLDRRHMSAHQKRLYHQIRSKKRRRDGNENEGGNR